MQYTIEPEHGFSDYFFCDERIDPPFYPHIHSHIEFVFVLDGAFEVTVSKTQYRLEAGQMTVIMPYEPHGHTGAARVFLFACPPEYLSEYRQLLSGKVFSPPYTSFSQIHRDIITDIKNGQFADDFKKKALLYYTISRFLQDCTLQDTTTFEFDVYRKALIYISENYAENITLQKVADYVGVTPAHLSRVLNKDGKPGFSVIVNCIRVHAAHRMLEQESKTVTEAALASGFGSIRNFNRAFQQYFGCNPTDIKK